jgi:hypothetical protein
MGQVDQAADEAQPEADDAAGAVGVDRRMPATKTKTQRNKEQRHRQVTHAKPVVIWSALKRLAVLFVCCVGSHRIAAMRPHTAALPSVGGS